jgi:two-component system, OmpR family, alkaline phosphatase synthesis response regulator PhoP
MAHETILIVDDEQDILSLLEVELSSEGYRIIQAMEGREAVQKAREHLPDLIVMDIMMPEMDGAEAVRVLKENPVTRNIPVIFLTAMVRKEEEQEGFLGIEIDGEHFVTVAKPFNAQELISEVKSALEKQ